MVGRLITVLALALSIQSVAQTVQESENVILLVDQPFYGIGESITFHAMITTTEKGIEKSQYVYVDLVDANGTIQVHQKIKAKHSIAKGEINLSSSMQAGVYRLYAYTRSMFTDVEAFGAMEEVSIYSADAIPANIDQPPFKIFTKVEGGQLIPGVEANVYYRIEGESPGDKIIDLIDIDGNVAATIDLTKPIGSIKFTAVEGQSYRFNTLHEGNLFPSVKSRGSYLSVQTTNRTFDVAVEGYNLTTLPDMLEVTLGGVVVYNEVPSFGGSSWKTSIPRQDLPDGLLSVVLLSNSKVINQRTIRNDYHQSKTEISISTNKEVFSKRDQVDVTIDASIANDQIRSDMVIKVIQKSAPSSDPAFFKASDQTDLELIGITLPYSKASRGPIEPVQFIQATINPVPTKWNKGNSTMEYVPPIEDFAFVAGYFVQDERAAETRVENGKVGFKIPDLVSTNDCWFYGFDSFGKRLGEVTLQVQDEAPLPTYTPSKLQLEVNNEIIDYLNRLKQRNTITRVFGEVKDMDDIAEPLEEANVVIFPDQYTDFEDFRSFIISVIPKATVKKKKGQENIILMPGHSYNKFKSNPLYLINGYPTFDGPTVLNIPLKEATRVEVTNALPDTRKYGLLGSNGIFSVHLTEENSINLDSIKANTIKIPGLNYSYNTADNQVLGKHQRVNYPDFRSLLYTSEPFYSDVSGKSVFTFTTSDLYGEFEILVYGVTEDGIPFHARKSIVVEPPAKM